MGGLLYSVYGFPLPFWVAGVSQALIATITSLVLEKDEQLFEETKDEDRKPVNLIQVAKAPGLLPILFGLMAAGSAWECYSAALE